MQNSKYDELFVPEQVEQIKQYTKPDRDLIESTKWRVHNPDRVYTYVFRIFCVSVLAVLFVALAYFLGYAFPTSQKLMNEIKDYQKQLGECRQAVEECVQEDGFIAQKDQKKLEKEYIKVYDKYLKKDSQLYQSECEWIREDLAADQTDIEEADWKEMDSEQMLLEEMRKKGKEVTKYVKENYRIYFNRAEVSVSTRTIIVVGDEEYDFPSLDTKTCYTFEKTKEGWRIVEIDLERI